MSTSHFARPIAAIVALAASCMAPAQSLPALGGSRGAEKAKELGELPARKRPQMPMIQIGN